MPLGPTGLDLESRSLGEAGASVLAASLGSDVTLTRLKGLWLGHNALGDNGLAVLAPSLRTLPRLRTLSLNGNGISDEGVAALLNAGTGPLEALEALDLSSNPLTNAALVELADALRRGGLPALLVLMLFHTFTSDAEREAVQDLLRRAISQPWVGKRSRPARGLMAAGGQTT